MRQNKNLFILIWYENFGDWVLKNFEKILKIELAIKNLKTLHDCKLFFFNNQKYVTMPNPKRTAANFSGFLHIENG